MKFAEKFVYNKLVANLLLCHVSKFHSICLSSLKIVVVTSNCCEVLVLWIFQNSQETLSVLVYFGWEFFCDVLEWFVDNLLSFP